MLRRPAALPALLFAVALLLPACATLGGSSTDEGDEPDRRPPPREEEPPQKDSGEEAPSEPRTVQGFRIQVLTTGDKDAAEQRAADAEAQWGAPVKVAWKAPYYRVRVEGALLPRARGRLRLARCRAEPPRSCPEAVPRRLPRPRHRDDLP